MKKYILNVIILLNLCLITACGKDNTAESISPAAQTTEESGTEIPATEEPTKSPATEIPTTEESTKAPTTEPSENLAVKESKEIKGSKLFENVYVKYASREKPFNFNSVKKFVESTNYKSKIVEPTNDTIGEITVTAKNDDSVYFAFNTVNDVETITTVSYNKLKLEVSFSNYSTDGDPVYDKLETHIIGEPSKEVDSIQKQREFLFSKK